jgi:hypothetical protein
VKQRAVYLTPDGHPHKPGCLSNLGDSLHSRFKRLGDIANLDEAITAQQQAVRPQMVTLTSLHASITFLRRFEQWAEIADLDEAITTQQQAPHLTPDGYHDKPQILNNLSVLGLATIMIMRPLLKPSALTHNPPSPHLVLHLSALQPPACGLPQSIPMKP